MLKFVVIVVVAFAESKKGQEERVACGTFCGIRLPTDGVTCAVDQKGAMLKNNDAGDAGDQKGTERSRPSIPQKAEERWWTETDQDRDQLNMSILPADELVFLKVGDVIV